MLTLLLTAQALALDCVERLAREALGDRLEAAEEAFLALDEPGFRDRTNELAGLIVPCVGDLVPKDLAARYHRLMAVHLDALGDQPNAILSARAARAVDPAAGFDDRWLGSTHPARLAFEAPGGGDRTRTAPRPRSGSLVFDGVTTRERPTERPTLFQVFDESGGATLTTYLGPREPLPVYPAVPVRRIALASSSGASAVAGGVLLALAGGQAARLTGLAADPTTPADALERARASTNGLSVAGTSLLGASIGLGVGAALVGPR